MLDEIEKIPYYCASPTVHALNGLRHKQISMPQLANAKKALRQSKKKAARNKVHLDEIHSLRRKLRKLLEAGKNSEAIELVKLLDKRVDKAVKKNLFKMNKGARIKSRYMAHVNEATAAKKEEKTAK